MAQKKVYFHKVALFKENFSNEVDYKQLKELYKEIFDIESKNKSLLLNNKNGQVTLDIVKNDGNFLYGKLGKIRDKNSFQFRDTYTNMTKPIIAPGEEEHIGIENFTHFILDYETGIISLVVGQASPKAKVMQSIFDKYNDTYKSKIDHIPNIELYKELFKGNSKLNNITLSLPLMVANEEIFKDLNIENIGNKALIKNATSIEVTFKSNKAKPLQETKDDNSQDMRELIEAIISSEDDILDAYVKGNPDGEKQKKYSLFNQMYYDTIDIGKASDYDSLEGNVLDQMTERYFREILGVYKSHKSKLRQLINRPIR